MGSSRPASPGEVTRRRLGLPRLPPDAPLQGYLLIADRDNNQIIIVSEEADRLALPSGGLGRGQSFAGPDDAFLTPDGGSIITNEEFADTIAIIRLARKPQIWSKPGHAGSPGCARFLAHP